MFMGLGIEAILLLQYISFSESPAQRTGAFANEKQLVTATT
jgi:hypothetical protein